MKCFREKVVGLGLALVAGSARAGDDWRAPGSPAAPVTGAPGLLPPVLRTAKPETGPIWLPARDSTAAPLVRPAGGTTEPGPVVSPTPAPQPQPQPTPVVPVGPGAAGPRLSGDTSGPLPAVPVPEFAAQPERMPAPPAERHVAPEPRQPDPVAPRPAPVDPPPKMTPPRAPDTLPPARSDPLPTPRPVEAPAALPELHPAPPELMYPAGAMGVNRHGTFGSPPLRISRDYSALQGLTGSGGGASAEDALRNRFFVRGEYLLWWMPGFPVPVLGTTNPDPTASGFFGEPGTRTILGPGSLLDSTRSGFRIRAGAWLNEGHSFGIDAGFFFLGNLSDSESRGAAQFPVITRPVFAPNNFPGTNTLIGEFGEAVAVPGILNGTLSAQSDSRMWGADVNLRCCLFTRCDARAELFVGYRHLNLRESLTIGEDITVIGDGGDRFNIPDPVGTRVFVQDRFATRNYFHGGQIGAYYERQFGRWVVDARASVALGSMHQVLEISGAQTRIRPGMAPMTFTGGGLLAAGPNIGRFERDKFSVAPEFTLNLGYQVTPRVRLFGGYNFLMWTNVIRPGDQIDRVVDLTFVPNAPTVAPSGQNRPRPLFAQRDLVINGVQFGLDLRW